MRKKSLEGACQLPPSTVCIVLHCIESLLAQRSWCGVSLTWSLRLTFSGFACERPHSVTILDSSDSKQNTSFTLNKSSRSAKKIQSLEVNEIYRLWLGK